MRHCRIRLGPVPMPLARFDLHHVTDMDLSLLVFGSDIASARSHDQELVAIMRMPSSITSLTKMHHTTVIIGGVPGRNDGLPRPGYRACPPRRLLGGAFHGKNRDIVECDDAHTDVSCCPACERLCLSYQLPVLYHRCRPHGSHPRRRSLQRPRLGTWEGSSRSGGHP